MKTKKATELVKRHELENNPIVIIEQDGEFTVTLGKYMLERAVPTLEEATKLAEKVTINRVLQLINILKEI